MPVEHEDPFNVIPGFTGDLSQSESRWSLRGTPETGGRVVDFKGSVVRELGVRVKLLNFIFFSKCPCHV